MDPILLIAFGIVTAIGIGVWMDIKKGHTKDQERAAFWIVKYSNYKDYGWNHGDAAKRADVDVARAFPE